MYITAKYGWNTVSQITSVMLSTGFMIVSGLRRSTSRSRTRIGLIRFVAFLRPSLIGYLRNHKFLERASLLLGYIGSSAAIPLLVLACLSDERRGLSVGRWQQLLFPLSLSLAFQTLNPQLHASPIMGYPTARRLLQVGEITYYSLLQDVERENRHHCGVL